MESVTEDKRERSRKEKVLGIDINSRGVKGGSERKRGKDNSLIKVYE